jgi:predicted DNA-binding transcriptional regulator AlpA
MSEAKYFRTEHVGIGWIVTATGISADEINALVRRNEFPLPTPNVNQGVPLWDRAEVLAWMDSRGVARTLRRREFIG